MEKAGLEEQKIRQKTASCREAPVKGQRKVKPGWNKPKGMSEGKKYEGNERNEKATCECGRTLRTMFNTGPVSKLEQRHLNIVQYINVIVYT
ncbi:hypothetical protein TNIN_232071 [Trichonephila inaurata madagascariensis]|uniref:Uncharacterized protein n=1 Tax=Trichonephila inaurata madagascariensis TaxID=2747483 RepID=A0A8X6X6H5_9ARAC|nr:hypothetical protein TNIN_232071 [Trichonephila inaurata madagascariensis]